MTVYVLRCSWLDCGFTVEGSVWGPVIVKMQAHQHGHSSTRFSTATEERPTGKKESTS